MRVVLVSRITVTFLWVTAAYKLFTPMQLTNLIFTMQITSVSRAGHLFYKYICKSWIGEMN